MIHTIIPSCKKDEPLKDELTGEKSILVGEWEWVYTDHSFGWCYGDNWEETLTPASEGTSFKLKIHKLGLIEMHKGDSLVSEYRIRFDNFRFEDACLLSNAHAFGIHLNDLSELWLNGCVNSDSLRLGDFPSFLFSAEDGCESYISLFTKSN